MSFQSDLEGLNFNFYLQRGISIWIHYHHNYYVVKGFEGLSGFRRNADDIVILTAIRSMLGSLYSSAVTEKYELTLFYKVKYCQSKVTFVGFQLSTEGYQQLQRQIQDYQP